MCKELTTNIEDVLDVPKEYYSISVPKLNISRVIKERLDEKEMTIRELGSEIGMKHPQIVRITSAQNYNVDTLLKILDGLGLELVVRNKQEERGGKE